MAHRKIEMFFGMGSSVTIAHLVYLRVPDLLSFGKNDSVSAKGGTLVLPSLTRGKSQSTLEIKTWDPQS